MMMMKEEAEATSEADNEEQPLERRNENGRVTTKEKIFGASQEEFRVESEKKKGREREREREREGQRRESERKRVRGKEYEDEGSREEETEKG